MLIKIGRRNEKRWGILFTCLTIRAIYLDLLESLSSDAFLMAFRRFAARRGTPRHLYTDRETNFVGGRNELIDMPKVMEPELAEKLATHGARFHFNSPAAPSHGGVWEREVRAVKSALRVVLKD